MRLKEMFASREAKKAKAKFKKAYVAYYKLRDNYDCGEQLFLHISTDGSKMLRELLGLAQELIDKDPNAPKASLERLIGDWKTVLGDAA